MSTPKRVDFIALCLVVLCAPFAARAAAPLTPEQTAKIDQLVSAYMKAHQVPGLSIAVVVEGELVWSQGYGVADVENDVAGKATTVYRTASIGKTMTATAAMQLVEAGKLKLDADMRQYCPAFPAKPYKITTRQLLAHLSGIRHYGGPHDAEEQSSTKHYGNVVDAMAPFKDDALLFEPGTKYLYSTYGYDVLGCVIEGASGMPFLRYMEEHVWKPAQMQSTRDDDPSALIASRARGYALVGGKVRNALHVDMSNRMAAGGYVTTVNDLAKFAAAVMAGRLVSEATFREMTTPTVLPNSEKVPYGLGWGLELEQWHDDTWTLHGGSSPGVSGILALMPHHKFAVAILANLEDLPDRSDFAADVARVVLHF
ncbi:MAG TPA: serine hydrolase domain-containing protein [Steroidobacteraceae bacterium]|jgi:CubicO group peptidase (beta-lactamase class C family)